MPESLGLLEQRVAAAADLIASLRDRVSLLERELASLRAGITVNGASAPGDASGTAQPGGPACDPSVSEELARLRAERGLIRERIRELMKEFDRVSW